MTKKTLTKKICFIHIPKCGGVSVNDGIKKSLGLGKISLQSARIKASRTKKEAIAAGMEILEYREKRLVEKLKSKRIRYLRGHVRCTSKVRQQFEKDWNFITILRNPVDRWISEYFYNLSKKSSHYRTNLTLNEYLESENGIEAGTVYIRYFTDNKNDTVQKLMDQTVHNLESFKLVGILEKLNEFQSQYELIFGKKLILANKNLNPISKTEIDKQVSPQQISQIEDLCASDIQVYQHFAKK